MTRYRAPATERVACAQHIQAKVTGVNQTQERHALPSSDEFIAKYPDKYAKLPSPGDCFLDTNRVPYAD